MALRLSRRCRSLPIRPPRPARCGKSSTPCWPNEAREGDMAKIAISYRRSDSQDITGRIFDRLSQQYGRDTVFRDIDSIQPGIDFRAQIADALTATDVLLVIVGPRWLGRGEGIES